MFYFIAEKLNLTINDEKCEMDSCFMLMILTGIRIMLHPFQLFCFSKIERPVNPFVRFSKCAFIMAINCGLFTILYPITSNCKAEVCSSGAPKQNRSIPSSITLPKSLSSQAK